MLIRLCEIFTQLLASGIAPDQALARAVRLAIGSALTDQACLALMELAAFHFAPLFESLGSAAKKCRRQARLPTLD